LFHLFFKNIKIDREKRLLILRRKWLDLPLKQVLKGMRRLN